MEFQNGERSSDIQDRRGQGGGGGGAKVGLSLGAIVVLGVVDGAVADVQRAVGVRPMDGR